MSVMTSWCDSFESIKSVLWRSCSLRSYLIENSIFAATNKIWKLAKAIRQKWLWYFQTKWIRFEIRTSGILKNCFIISIELWICPDYDAPWVCMCRAKTDFRPKARGSGHTVQRKGRCCSWRTRMCRFNWDSIFWNSIQTNNLVVSK